MTDVTSDAALFDVAEPDPVTLADKFGVPPFSVFDGRSGVWQDRKRRWLRTGVQSELGRMDDLLGMGAGRNDPVSLKLTQAGSASIFDPVLCELAYRWFSPPGARVLDPFAGGSVRGVTASILGRHYLGVDIRPEQVAANEAQSHIGTGPRPDWVVGDSSDLDVILDPSRRFDFVFTCPPYADLEVYSDDPGDLSTMDYATFLTAHRDIIAQSVARLRRDRFAVWVISDVRDPRTGSYRGLVHETVGAFMDAGAALHNDIVYLNAAATAGLRAERPFEATRKVVRVHQHALVFVKGSAARAAAYCKGAQS